MPAAIRDVAAQFAVDGQLLSVEPFLGGHINDSYRLTYRQGQATARYLLQRLNSAVFRDPAAVMENTARVTAHIAQRLRARGTPDLARRTLRLLPTRHGGSSYVDAAGAYWRLFPLIENTTVHELVTSPELAEQAGRAFGEFQSLLADLPPPRLRATIPDFHNTPARFAALDDALAADVCGRVAAARPEIDFALARRGLAGVLLELHAASQIPERVVHNDAKITNVLLDAATGEALCVVDLDTVMPGLSLYDFGDMVRTMTSPTAEDTADLAQVEVQPRLFEALARGYLSATGSLLTRAERAHLVTAGKLITLEQGVRFLTDFLRGDTYYKTRRPNHNLDRTRTQLRLLESLERQEGVLRRLVGR